MCHSKRLSHAAVDDVRTSHTPPLTHAVPSASLLPCSADAPGVNPPAEHGRGQVSQVWRSLASGHHVLKLRHTATLVFHDVGPRPPFPDTRWAQQGTVRGHHGAKLPLLPILSDSPGKLRRVRRNSRRSRSVHHVGVADPKFGTDLSPPNFFACKTACASQVAGVKSVYADVWNALAAQGCRFEFDSRRPLLSS
eukprot:3960810-Prymnesium_polylepis.1